MKKYSMVILLVTMFFILGSLQTISVSAKENSMIVKVDNHAVKFNVDPVVQQGTTMVQIAPIFKGLGVTYTWDQDKKQIIAKKMDTEIIMTLGSKTVYVKGRPVSIAQAPISKNGYVMVPLRFVSETTGATVSRVGNMINITSLAKDVDFSFGGKKVTPNLIQEYLTKTYPSAWDGINSFSVKYEVFKSDEDGSYDIEIVFDNLDDIELLLEDAENNEKIVENLTNSLAVTINNLFKQNDLYFYITLKMEVSEPLDVDIPAIHYEKSKNGNYLLILPEFFAYYDFNLDVASYYIVDSKGKINLMYSTDTKWTID